MKMDTPDAAAEMRFPGMQPARDGRFVRLVDRHVIHGDAMDFKELCRLVIKDRTRFLVLDLDGTFHRRLNLGVLLGWELSAYQAFGEDFLKNEERYKRRGAFVFDWDNYQAQGKYAKIGARQWFLPGMVYYSMARMGWRIPSFQKAMRRSLGPLAMERLLCFMRLCLMHQMSRIPLHDVYRLVDRLWKRCEDYLVIEPAHVRWIRKTWPDLKIIVSSASPRACLEIVRERYPVHDVISTEIETRNGFASAPHWMHPLFGSGTPQRIAPPGSLRQNASYRKIARIAARHPEFLDPDVHTVGITDTKHGEDSCWTEFFKCVADINSPDPFSPLVSTASPLEEIHSAHVLTRGGKLRREAVPGGGGSLPGERPPRDYSHGDLERLASREKALAEHRAARCHALGSEVKRNLEPFSAPMDALARKVEDGVADYNASQGARRNRVLDQLRLTLGDTYHLTLQINHAQSPVSREMSGIERLQGNSRARLGLGN